MVKISIKSAHKVFRAMIETGKNPDILIKEMDLALITDIDKIENIISNVIDENSNIIKTWHKDKNKLHNFIFGKIIEKCNGKISSTTIKEILRNKL